MPPPWAATGRGVLVAAAALLAGTLVVRPAAGVELAASQFDRPGVSHNEQCVSSIGDRPVQVRGVAGEQLTDRRGAVLDVPEAGPCQGGKGISLEGIEALSPRGRPMYYAWPQSEANSPGFVLGEELAAGVALRGGAAAGNGGPAPSAFGEPYYLVEPVRIPGSQCYPGRARPNRSCREGYLSFEPYGLPTDEQPGYTLMTWSWTNVAGGGIARAAVAAGTRFFPAQVQPIVTDSYGPGAEADGSVTARYGFVLSGQEQVYGWMVTSSTFEGSPAEGELGCENHMLYGGGGPPLPATLCGPTARTALDGPIGGPNVFASGTAGSLWELVIDGGRLPSIRPAPAVPRHPGG